MMKRVDKRVFPFLIIFLVADIFGIAASEKVFQNKGLVEGKPGKNVYPTGDPGETAILERPYFIAPPLIPHSVADFEIKRKGNDCLECHIEGMEFEDGHVATKIPPSHYYNDFKKKKTEGMVTGVRYNCIQCHAPQSVKDPPYSLKKK
jgi:nitrate reductase cytochrome c-type subunit